MRDIQGKGVKECFTGLVEVIVKGEPIHVIAPPSAGDRTSASYLLVYSISLCVRGPEGQADWERLMW